MANKKKWPFMLKIIYFLALLASSSALFAQNNSTIKLSGSLNFHLQAYEAIDLEPRRDAFTWRVSGAPILKLGEWNVPIFLLLGSYQSGLRQSFNRFGIRPEYKWIKLHLGHSKVNFSPLIMSRQYFLGGGIELNPGLFRFGFVYGKLRKSVQRDAFGKSKTSFARKGYSIKTGFGSEFNYVELIFLKAEDEIESIDFDSASDKIRPEENLALGISTLQRFANHLYLELHGGMSILNRDLRSAKSDSLDFVGVNAINNLITFRNSSQLLFALQSSLEYRKGPFRVGLGYDRIDPDYKTMGIFYMQDDVERWTLNAKWRMLQKRMKLSWRLGFENNNLKNDRFASQSRTIGVLHLNYRFKKALSIFGHYSNFTQSAELENIAFSDTLVFEQILNNAGAGFVLSILRPKANHQISFNGNYFVSANNHPGFEKEKVRFVNAQLLYQWSHLLSGWSFQLGADMLNTESENRNQFRLGPQGGLSKFLYQRKIYAGWRSHLYFDSRENESYNKVFRHTLSVNFRLWKKHSLRFRGYYMHTAFANSSIVDYKEFQTDLNFRMML